MVLRYVMRGLFLNLTSINPLNPELNPICHLLALLGGATIVVVSRLRVNVGPMVRTLYRHNKTDKSTQTQHYVRYQGPFASEWEHVTRVNSFSHRDRRELYLGFYFHDERTLLVRLN
jgi:hypothetical protein